MASGVMSSSSKFLGSPGLLSLEVIRKLKWCEHQKILITAR